MDRRIRFINNNSTYPIVEDIGEGLYSIKGDGFNCISSRGLVIEVYESVKRKLEYESRDK